jgi:hypothetical protein
MLKQYENDEKMCYYSCYGLNKAVHHTIHANAVKSAESYTGANCLGPS